MCPLLLTQIAFTIPYFYPYLTYLIVSIIRVILRGLLTVEKLHQVNERKSFFVYVKLKVKGYLHFSFGLSFYPSWTSLLVKVGGIRYTLVYHLDVIL